LKFFLIITLIISSFTFVYANEIMENEEVNLEVIPVDTEPLAEPQINAASAIVMDFESGRVLFEKNADRVRPMASTTKIMTAIVALENGNLEDVVTVSKKAASIGGSRFGLSTGDKYKLRDLLYGLLICSGNDASIAIAEHVGGSVEQFVNIMNEKARLLGARNSHFRNTHGLDQEGHYTTAYDLALITRYALGNETFNKIVSTKSVTIGSRTITNTNEMLSLYDGADGVKTGYTGLAGRCLVSSATRGDMRLISVALYCSSRTQRALSSKSILDYAFHKYEKKVITKPGVKVTDLQLVKGKKNKVEIRTAEGFDYPLSDEETKKIELKYYVINEMDAPVFAGTDVGTLNIILDGEVIGQVKLKIWETVEKKGFYDYIRDMLGVWLGEIHTSF
jgi:D-alanyl-D-alanine carboxypeptidase (penicillin-binding protein 5/6)